MQSNQINTLSMVESDIKRLIQPVLIVAWAVVLKQQWLM